MQELIITQNVPAKLDADFPAMRRALEVELQRYDVVVTQDTVKSAKKLATELNTSKNAIRKAGSEAYKNAIAPADEFRARVAEFVDMVEERRQALLSQVKTFEDETRAKASDLLEQWRAQQWEHHCIEEEFRRAQYSDLAVLTAVTGKGNLAASAREKLDQRIQDDKRLQDQTKIRLLQLENESYRAGLAAPLTRDHVQPFLFLDDAAYTAELARIITAEIQRQEAAEQRMREQMRKEQQFQPTPEPELVLEENQTPEPAEQVRTDNLKPGKVSVCVHATFNLEVSDHITDDQITTELRRVMNAAGITTLSGIRVDRRPA